MYYKIDYASDKTFKSYVDVVENEQMNVRIQTIMVYL